MRKCGRETYDSTPFLKRPVQGIYCYLHEPVLIGFLRFPIMLIFVKAEY